MQVVVDLVIILKVTDLVCSSPYFFKNQSTHLQSSQAIFKSPLKDSLSIFEGPFIMHLTI